ncbi:leukotriene B4 receptor 1-like [Poecilia reticulata]|uniref:leukotriene B4 receptor 1-like n=1 Tax=Poecilia reticulata TaxID=8081 RepID=UPI0004A346E6|nr:PREDICTED: leukotriene B4 receptor 1-like [Poecilia reticulata]
MDNNSNMNTSDFSLPPRTWVHNGLIPAVLLSFCFLLGVPGNIAVILLKPNWQNMSRLSQSLMLNLAIFDLLSLLTLPLWIYALLSTWTFSLGTCKLLGFLVYCSLYGSLLTVTALGVQRYIVVVNQRRCVQVQKSHLLVPLWFGATVLSIPALVTERVETNIYDGWRYCYPQFSSRAQGLAVLLSETTSGFVSFFVVAYSYIRLHRKIRQATFFNNPQTTRLLTSIIVSNFVLWSPLHTINMLTLGAICFENDSLLKFCVDIWDIVKAIAFLNNCINPLLYAFSVQKMCRVCMNQELTKPTQTLDISTVAETMIT